MLQLEQHFQLCCIRQYMRHKLAPKRLQSPVYVHRAQNKARDATSECIWWANETAQEFVRNYLIDNFEYYSYCSECMGTKVELALPHCATLQTPKKNGSHIDLSNVWCRPLGSVDECRVVQSDKVCYNQYVLLWKIVATKEESIHTTYS